MKMKQKMQASLRLQLIKLIKRMNLQTHDSNKQLQNFTLKDACEYIRSYEMLKPPLFIKHLGPILNYLQYFKDQNDRSTIILYETIKYNIQKNSNVYKCKLYQASIAKYAVLINYQIYKILRIQQKTLLNIQKNNNQVMLRILEPKSALALTFINLFNSVINEHNFNAVMRKFSESYTQYAKSKNFIMLAAFFICISEIINIQGINVEQNQILLFLKQVVCQDSILNFYSLYALSQSILKLDFSKFSQNYQRQFFRVINLGLKSGNGLLVHEAMKCLKLFLNKFGFEKLSQENIDYIQQRIVFLIVESNLIVLQNLSFDCLVKIFDIFQFSNLKKIQNFLDFCYDWMILKKEYLNYFILNKVLKCMCQTISSLGYYEKIQSYIDNILSIFLTMQNIIQTETLLISWSFLCIAGIKFQICGKIFSKVFQNASQYCNNSQLSKRSLGYLVLKQSSICFEVKFIDYFFSALQTIKKCLKEAVQRRQTDQVKLICSALDAILSNQRPKLIYSQYSHQNTNKVMLYKKNQDQNKFFSKIYPLIIEIIQYFYQIFLQTFLFEIKQPLLFSLKVIFEHYGDKISKIDSDIFYKQFWLTVKAFNSQRNLKLSFKEQMLQINNNQKLKPKFFCSDEDALNRCIIALPLILESIIKYIPTLQVNPRTQIDGLDFDINCEVRYYACFLQFITPEEIDNQNTYQKIRQFLQTHSNNNLPRIRTQVSYAISIIVYKTTFNEFQTKIFDFLRILQICENVQNNSLDQKEEFGKCLDNIMCAIGHIFYKFRNHFNKLKQSEHHNTHDLFYTWLNKLPLKYDKKQQKQQIDFLSNIVIQKLATLLEQMEDCKQCKTETQNTKIKIISKIFTIFLDVKIRIKRELRIRENRDTLKRAKKALKNIQKWPFYVENSNQIINLLSEEQRANLQELLKREYLI